MKHTSPISGVASFSARYIATAGYDNQVILWDANSGAALARGLHDHLANQCAFNFDGTKLVSASSDRSARIWAVPSMSLCSLLTGHLDDVEMAVFSPGGDLVATCSRDYIVRTFTVDGTLCRELVGHTEDVISVTWSANGEFLISSSDDGTVRTWSVETGTQIAVFDASGAQTDSIAVAASGRIYAGNDLGYLITMDKTDVTSVKAHDAGVKRVLLNTSNTRLVTLSYDRTLAIWDVTGTSPQEVVRSGLPPVVWARSAAFMSDTQLAFATFGSTFAQYFSDRNTWEIDQVHDGAGVNAIACIDGHEFTVGDAGVVKQDGVVVQLLGSLCNFLIAFEGRVLTGGHLGKVFDALTGSDIYTHRSPLNCATTFESGGMPYLAVGTYTGEALIFRGRDLQFVQCVTLHENAIKGISANHLGIFSVSASGAIALHEPGGFSAVWRVIKGHDRIPNGCVSFANGFASVGRDLTLRLWSGEGLTRIEKTPHENSIKCISSDPTGRLIATASYGGRIAIYAPSSDSWLYSRRLTSAGISNICFDVARGQFVASSYDGNLYRVRDIPFPENEELAA